MNSRRTATLTCAIAIIATTAIYFSKSTKEHSGGSPFPLLNKTSKEEKDQSLRSASELPERHRVPAIQEAKALVATTRPKNSWLPAGIKFPDTLGHTAEEILTEWWGPDWPTVKQYFDQIPEGPYTVQLKLDNATVDSCLASLADLLLQDYQLNYNRRRCTELPSHVMSGRDHSTQLAKEYLRYLLPRLPGTTGHRDTESVQFKAFSDTLKSEMEAAEAFGANTVLQIEKFLVDTLSPVDRYRQPETGWLWFSPLLGTHHRDSTIAKSEGGPFSALWTFSLSISSTRSRVTDCGGFIARYDLDLHDVPHLASQIQTIETYGQDVEDRLRLLAASVPMLP